MPPSCFVLLFRHLFLQSILPPFQATCKIATPRRTWPTSNGSLVCWPRESVFWRKRSRGAGRDVNEVSILTLPSRLTFDRLDLALTSTPSQTFPTDYAKSVKTSWRSRRCTLPASASSTDSQTTYTHTTTLPRHGRRPICSEASHMLGTPFHQMSVLCSRAREGWMLTIDSDAGELVDHTLCPQRLPRVDLVRCVPNHLSRTLWTDARYTRSSLSVAG